MKTTRFFAGISGLALIFVVLLSGCDLGNDTPGKKDSENTPSNSSGPATLPVGVEKGAQVYDVDGNPYAGSGTVKIRIWDLQDEEYKFFNAGTVTEGKITLNLPSSLDSKYLHDLAELAPEGITLDPSSGVSAYEGVGICLFDGGSGNFGGELYLGKEDSAGGDTDIDYWIQYWYFDKAVSITGAHLIGDNTHRYTVSAKPGWNIVLVWSTKSDGVEARTYTSDLTDAQSGLQWVFSEAGVSPDS